MDICWHVLDYGIKQQTGEHLQKWFLFDDKELEYVIDFLIAHMPSYTRRELEDQLCKMCSERYYTKNKMTQIFGVSDWTMPNQHYYIVEHGVKKFMDCNGEKNCLPSLPF